MLDSPELTFSVILGAPSCAWLQSINVARGPFCFSEELDNFESALEGISKMPSCVMYEIFVFRLGFSQMFSICTSGRVGAERSLAKMLQTRHGSAGVGRQNFWQTLFCESLPD